MSSQHTTNFSVPAGFPLTVKGPVLWSSADEPIGYITYLTSTDVEALEHAVRTFQDSGIGFHHVSKDNFPLPADLAAKLKSLSKIVHKGRGFAVLRGLDPTTYTEDENTLLYGGICGYIAEERADMIHIYDRAGGNRDVESTVRFPPNEVTTSMDFHTDVDAGDVLSLFTLSLPESGGQQYLVSFPTVYNQLARHEPEVLHTLASPWRYEMPTPSGPVVIHRPVIAYQDGHLQINFAVAFLVGSNYIPRLESSPSPTSAQIYAIKVLLHTCREYAFPLPQQMGDMLFANNLSVLHAREAFVDNPVTGQVRHLLSVMLRDPALAWQKPTEIAERIDDRFAKLNVPDFFGNVHQYELFRDKIAMLRHD